MIAVFPENADLIESVADPVRGWRNKNKMKIHRSQSFAQEQVREGAAWPLFVCRLLSVLICLWLSLFSSFIENP